MTNSSVIVINGSARDNSNTEVAVNRLCPFNEYVTVDLRHLGLSHFKYTTSPQDTFLEIAERMASSKAIVFATPVYWYSMSGLMKVFFDRLTELITQQKSIGRKLRGKDVYLIAQGTDPCLPQGFTVPFERTANYLGMNFVDHYYMSIKDSDNKEKSNELFCRLEGQSVILEPLRGDHRDGVESALAGMPESVWNHLPRKLNSADGVGAWLNAHLRQRDEGNRFPYAILCKHTSKVIGSTSYLGLDKVNGGVEIGWTWLTPKVWGSKVNAECKLLLLRHAFRKLRCRRVQFKTDHNNLRSRRALEKIGATYEGTLRKHMIMSTGNYRDSAFYSITDDDWHGVENHILKLLERDA